MTDKKKNVALVDFIFPLKLSFKHGFTPKLKPNAASFNFIMLTTL